MTLRANSANTTNPASAAWLEVMAQLADLLLARRIHPSRTVVLVPYAQLIQQARLAWTSLSAIENSFFMPRFETTMNWANALPGPALLADDIQMNCAIDTLTAASLLKRAGLAARQHELTGRLLDAALSLAPIAAAQVPGERLAWGARLANDIIASMDSPALVLELAIARIALAWASASNYPTDVLFNAQPDLLVVIEGFQSDPLTESLKTHFGHRAASLQLVTPLTSTPAVTPTTQGQVTLHAAADLEVEAQLAAACVLTHLAAGLSPVALVAQDRLLTRRVRAMLAGKGVVMRDETGWKLSTTRAAATVMGLLRAVTWDAPGDAVLDWLKNAPAFDARMLARFEAALRKLGIAQWHAVPAELPEFKAVVAQAALCRDAFQRSRPIAQWLSELRSALVQTGQWPSLAGDTAGLAVIAALHMESEQTNSKALPANPRMSLHEFTQWVNQALEAASFTPVHPPHAHVVILPLSQLLGRSLGAVVMPGCDELRFDVSPEPPGPWTPAQRLVLGLPSRVELARNQRAAWQHALGMQHMDVLWRQSEGGDSLMPSGFVQELLLRQKLMQQPAPPARDPRPQRTVVLQPVLPPQASGHALPMSRLSSTAYEDLRRCPYRFFALRQLKLQEAHELQEEISKRDFGNWLHLLLNDFHIALKNEQNTAVAQSSLARTAMLNIAATQATEKLGLSDEEFLPFAAMWPRVRDNYLLWLAGHEATGATYVEGEVWKSVQLGDIELVGKIDRIDQLPDGSRLVIDYKTEPRTTTQARIKDKSEDSQLTFYAALLDDDTLAAAYVSLSEKEPTKTCEQPDIVGLRDDLISGIVSDLQRIAAGTLLSALGEGKACEFCAARGLCRKDFWV